MTGQLHQNEVQLRQRDRKVILLADPNSLRRRQMVRHSAHYALLEAASLIEVYPLAEETAPDLIALSGAFLAEPELEAIFRLADYLGSALCIYAEPQEALPAYPLPDHVALVSLHRADGIDDLLLRLASRPTDRTPAAAPAAPEILLLGASTGGIAALETILASFPVNCPATVVVQHMRDDFMPGVIQRMNLRVRPRLAAGRGGETLERGTVYFAVDPARHLTLAGMATPRLALTEGPACQGHRPAVDPLFTSARPFAHKVAAALLTGMGSDGAIGLGVLRAAGAFTIAQDRVTSVVWGMPGAAVEAGAAEAVLPIGAIGPALLSGRSLRAATRGR